MSKLTFFDEIMSDSKKSDFGHLTCKMATKPILCPHFVNFRDITIKIGI